MSDENDGYVTSCSFCNRNFSQHKALYAHMRRFHKDKPIKYKQKRTIICSVCDEEQRQIKTYWDHIRSKHPEVQLSFEKKFFYSEEDFNKWRMETEAQTHTHFSAARSQNTLSDGRIVQQFQCDRSGIYNLSRTATRKCLSKKIGKFCPAYIYRTKTVVDDLLEIEVDFQSTHVGHKFDVHSIRIRSEQRERRLRNAGKGRWPKKNASPPPSENAVNEHNVDLDGKSKSFIQEVSDILERDPNLEIQHVTCNCEEYELEATCGHVQMLLKSLENLKSLTREKNSVDEHSGDVDASYVEGDIAPVMIEDFVNPVENGNMKSLDDEKALILEELHQVVNMCQNREQLEIFKDIIAKAKCIYFSALKCEPQGTSDSPANIDPAHHTITQSSVSYPMLNVISTSSLNTSAISLPYQNNLVVLREK